MTDRAAVTAEKHDFNFGSARRFRAVLQDVQRTYKDFCDRVLHEAKEASMLSYFKPSTSATQTSRQADTEDLDVRDLSVLMSLDDDEMLIGDPLPLPPTCPLATRPPHPSFSCLSLIHYHHYLLAFQGAVFPILISETTLISTLSGLCIYHVTLVFTICSSYFRFICYLV